MQSAAADETGQREAQGNNRLEAKHHPKGNSMSIATTSHNPERTQNNEDVK